MAFIKEEVGLSVSGGITVTGHATDKEDGQLLSGPLTARHEKERYIKTARSCIGGKQLIVQFSPDQRFFMELCSHCFDTYDFWGLFTHWLV